MVEFLLEDYVREEYLDFNNHMNVIAYYTAFHKASGKFISLIGFDRAEREKYHITIFTVETHLTYLKEITKDKKFKVYGRILEYDQKRIHFYEEMRNETGNLLSVCESMFLIVSEETRKAITFPENLLNGIKDFYKKTKKDDWPKYAGNYIGIQRSNKIN